MFAILRIEKTPERGLRKTPLAAIEQCESTSPCGGKVSLIPAPEKGVDE